MRVKVWGARGSVATPGPETTRYGGNTSCVEVTLDDGAVIVLDAGTGIRPLGLALARAHASNGRQVHILLTHLHLDHIQGLMFFAPCFQVEANLVIWGPASAEASLEERIARYISAPLSPVEVRELPCTVSFEDCPGVEWELGSARVRAESVTHRGPTLGYRVSEGDQSVCYIPDHEPALATPMHDAEREWISGFGLAQGASLLIHDCMYTDSEYEHHLGWGHSRLSDTLAFADRTNPAQLMLFHHDPMHDDAMLDAFGATAGRRWAELGRRPDSLLLAREGAELDLAAAVAASAVG